MSEADDARWMKHAIDEAKRGNTAPNPRVGAVLVDPAGVLISSGFHHAAGQVHAEVDAIQNAGRQSLQGATLYVTLEPCNHQGRTAPCTEAILATEISRVVVGYRDPKPHVPGGLERLAKAGLMTQFGVEELACCALVADFEKLITTGMPYVVLKAAVTLDGKMATRTGDSKWITGEAARTESHRLRAEADAVLVGIETVIADDPRLNVRHVEGNDPVRVVVDTQLRTPLDSALITDGSPTWIFHGPDVTESRRAVFDADLGAHVAHVECIEVPLVGKHLDLKAVLRELGRRDIMRLLVEGGGMVHGALLDAQLADYAVVFVAPRIVGDSSARSFAAGRGTDRMDHAWSLVKPHFRACGDDMLIEGTLARRA